MSEWSTQGIKSGLNLDLSPAVCRVLRWKLDLLLVLQVRAEQGWNQSRCGKGVRGRHSMEETLRITDPPGDWLALMWTGQLHFWPQRLLTSPPPIPGIHSQPFCLPALRQRVPCSLFPLGFFKEWPSHTNRHGYHSLVADTPCSLSLFPMTVACSKENL